MSRDVPATDGDSTRGRTGPTRRGVLRGAAVSVVAGGTLASLPLGLGQETVPTILLGGLTSAWQGFAPESIADQSNPTLNLVAGQRYRLAWENLDGVPHTFALQDETGARLQVLEVVEVSPESFAALRNVTTPDETVDNMTVANLTANVTEPVTNETPVADNETNVTAEEEAPELVSVTEQVAEEGAVQAVEFVATEEMATYICTVHPTTMVGDVTVDGDGMT